MAMLSTLPETWHHGYSQVVFLLHVHVLTLLVCTALAGWGPAVFTAYNHWWVVPVIACHAGAVAGAWIYYLVVEINWPAEEKYDSVGTNSQEAEQEYKQVGNFYLDIKKQSNAFQWISLP